MMKQMRKAGRLELAEPGGRKKGSRVGRKEKRGKTGKEEKRTGWAEGNQSGQDEDLD